MTPFSSDWRPRTHLRWPPWEASREAAGSLDPEPLCSLLFWPETSLVSYSPSRLSISPLCSTLKGNLTTKADLLSVVFWCYTDFFPLKLTFVTNARLAGHLPDSANKSYKSVLYRNTTDTPVTELLGTFKKQWWLWGDRWRPRSTCLCRRE